MGKLDAYDIIVGAETGLLKGVKVSQNSWQNLSSVDKVTREKEVTALCWSDDQQTEVCVGRRDRSIDVYSRLTGDIVNCYQDTEGEGTLKALAKWDSCFVTCTDKGQLKVIDSGQEKLSLDVGKDIFCLRQNPTQRNLFITGGKENDMKIWNLEDPTEPIFKAKNVKNDWLNLRVPVWVTDAGFLGDSDKVVTCTGHHQVRVYDPSSSMRRPVIDVEVDEYPLTCMSVRSSNNQVMVGNTHGLMALVDLRGKGYVVQKYKGFAGGIRSVHCHSDEDVVVSCGLDRFVRIHDINNRKLLNKFYMKSRLNCVLVADKWNSQSQTSEIQTSQSESMTLGSQGDDPGGSDDNDEEAVWSSMSEVKIKKSNETISQSNSKEKREKKKRRRLNDSDDEDVNEDECEDEETDEEDHQDTKKHTKPQRHKGKKSKKTKRVG